MCQQTTKWATKTLAIARIEWTKNFFSVAVSSRVHFVFFFIVVPWFSHNWRVRRVHAQSTTTTTATTRKKKLRGQQLINKWIVNNRVCDRARHKSQWQSFHFAVKLKICINDAMCDRLLKHWNDAWICIVLFHPWHSTRHTAHTGETHGTREHHVNIPTIWLLIVVENGKSRLDVCKQWTVDAAVAGILTIRLNASWAVHTRWYSRSQLSLYFSVDGITTACKHNKHTLTHDLASQ